MPRSGNLHPEEALQLRRTIPSDQSDTVSSDSDWLDSSVSDAPLSRSECTDDECGGAEDENNILDATLTCVVHQIVLVGLGRQHYPAKPAGQEGRKRHKNVLRSNPGPTLHASRRIETMLSLRI